MTLKFSDLDEQEQKRVWLEHSREFARARYSDYDEKIEGAVVKASIDPEYEKEAMVSGDPFDYFCRNHSPFETLDDMVDEA